MGGRGLAASGRRHSLATLLGGATLLIRGLLSALGGHAERAIQALHVLAARLGVHVALGRRQVRVAEEVLDEYRVGLAGDQAAGAVAQAVELHLPQPGRLTRRVVSASNRGVVQSLPEPVAEDVVVALREVAAHSQTLERARGRVSQRDVPDLPRLRRSLDAG